MSFVPVQIPARCIRQADVTVGIVQRLGAAYVDFRFSRAIYKAAGWSRYTRISPFLDIVERQLMFATAEDTDSAARALTYQGGLQLSVRWARMHPFDSLFPVDLIRTAVPVVRAGEGQLVLDLTPILNPTPATPIPNPLTA
jgi:hypothetical protein